MSCIKLVFLTGKGKNMLSPCFKFLLQFTIVRVMGCVFEVIRFLFRIKRSTIYVGSITDTHF